MYQQFVSDDGRELRVFLVNGLTDKPAQGFITEDAAFTARAHININETVPVHDIGIMTSRPVTEARDLRGEPLRVERAAGVTRIFLPKLNLYDVVRFAYGEHE